MSVNVRQRTYLLGYSYVALKTGLFPTRQCKIRFISNIKVSLKPMYKYHTLAVINFDDITVQCTKTYTSIVIFIFLSPTPKSVVLHCNVVKMVKSNIFVIR